MPESRRVFHARLDPREAYGVRRACSRFQPVPKRRHSRTHSERFAHSPGLRPMDLSVAGETSAISLTLKATWNYVAASPRGWSFARPNQAGAVARGPVHASGSLFLN